jgi:cell division protein FtsB
MNSFQYGNYGNGVAMFKLVLAIIIILITVYVSNESLKYFYKINNLESSLETKQNQADKLKATLKEKERELDRLNSDWGKEEYLRNTYRASSKDEKLITFTESSSTDDFEIISDEVEEESVLKTITTKMNYLFKRYINL